MHRQTNTVRLPQVTSGKLYLQCSLQHLQDECMSRWMVGNLYWQMKGRMRRWGWTIRWMGLGFINRKKRKTTRKKHQQLLQGQRNATFSFIVRIFQLLLSVIHVRACACSHFFSSCLQLQSPSISVTSLIYRNFISIIVTFHSGWSIIVFSHLAKLWTFLKLICFAS